MTTLQTTVREAVDTTTNTTNDNRLVIEGGKSRNCIQRFFFFLWYLLEAGSGKLLRSWEIPLVYSSPLIFSFVCYYYSSTTKDENEDNESTDVIESWCFELATLVVRNAYSQGLLFLIVVQIPTLLTGHMSYVDIGWPTGLVLLSYHVLFTATTMNTTNTNNIRIVMIGIALALHGGRMAIGAIIMFFPYHWKEDLPRYQYAKQKWINQMTNKNTNTNTTSTSSSSSSSSWWWLKQQQETLFQAFCNAFIIACPIFVAITDPTPPSYGIMGIIIGFLSWLFFWCTENYADAQKSFFLKAARQNGNHRTAVLGLAPYDRPFRKYGLWTLCRHPNYFCEFMCWNSFMIMCLPSCWNFMTVMMLSSSELWVKIIVILSLSLNILYVSRVFYDCLLYWTGAEPSEIRSVQRRPLYRTYQQTVPMFIPKFLPQR